MNRLAFPAALILGSICSAALLTTLPAHAGRFRAAHANADGGVTRSFGAAHAGEAASGARGHRLVTDSQGNAQYTSGAVVNTANGGSFKRAGRTTRSADGSAAHASGFSASGANGTVQSSGSASRDPDGQITQSRSTTATSATTGNTVTSTTSYSSDGGREHSVSCFDASGAAIACKR